MDNPQEIKNLIIKKLIEDKQYDKVLAHLGSEEKDNSLTKLIKPMSAVADILTENAKGSFMGDVDKKVDEVVTKASEELKKDLEEAHESLKTELKQAINTDRDDLSSDILNRVTEAQERLQETLSRYADSIVTQKADSMFSDLGELAKLNEEEIQEIVDEAALSVETQIASIIGDYIAETGITTAQITDFDKAVRRLIPPAQQVTWDSIVDKPNMSQGGTNTNVVKALIAEALAGFTPGSGVPPGGTTGQVLTKQSNADGDADWQTPSGGSGAVDSVNGQTGVVVLDTDDITEAGNLYYTEARVSANSDVAANSAYRGVGHIPLSQKGAVNGVAELDANGHVPASQLPSFVDDVIEVANFAALPITGETGKIYITLDTNIVYRWSGSAYVEISASLALGETSSTAYRGDRGKEAYDLRHAAVTVSGTPNYITLVGQDIVRALINLTSHVTGKLPFANLANGSAHSVVGRAGSGSGDVGNITAGNNTVLSRDGSGNVAFNSASTIRSILGLGTAATTDATAYATAAQGALADTALQPAAIGTTIQAYSAVLAATTASFTSADETKLDGIEAGADVTDSTNVLAALNGQDPVVNLITYDAARGKVTAGGNLGATETINFNDETNYTGTLDSNITFTFANATSGDDVTLYLSYSGAQRTITWPTITWLDNNNGSAPATPSASGHVLVVTVRYIGSVYYASATGNYSVYS